MTEEDKCRFDALDALRKAGYDSFDHRRSYEWKLSFGIWTALAAFTAALVTQPVESGKHLPIAGPWAQAVTLVIVGLVAYLHSQWLIGMGRSNNADRLISWHYENEMRDNLLKLPFDTALNSELATLRRKMGRLTNWSYSSQLAITVLLGIAAFLAMAARS